MDDKTKQRLVENQIHGLLQAAMTLAADYDLVEVERRLVDLARHIRDQRQYEARQELHRRIPA